MAFMINSAEPPECSRPGGRSSKLERPEAVSLDGNGRPCKAVGRPKVTLMFEKMSITGWTWYAAITGTSTFVALTNLTVWDAHKVGGPGFTTFTGGYMYRPTYKSYEYGAYTDVEIRFTELEG